MMKQFLYQVLSFSSLTSFFTVIEYASTCVGTCNWKSIWSIQECIVWCFIGKHIWSRYPKYAFFIMRFYLNNCNISVKELIINKPTRIFNGAYAVAKSVAPHLYVKSFFYYLTYNMIRWSVIELSLHVSKTILCSL